MKIEQKIIALDILRNAGSIATERGRKAAILEIMGHGMLAARLMHTGDRIDFEIAEIHRLSVGEPVWPDTPDGHEPPAALVKAERMLDEKRDDMRAVDAEVHAIADALEAEINATDRGAIARRQEGNVQA